MTHTQFLKKLGAPLRSVRESWGSVREFDNTVFLLLWQDQIRKIGNEQFIRITARNKLGNEQGFGPTERLEHIARIQSGPQCYAIICIAKDVTVRPRVIKDYVSDRVFKCGDIIEHENELWVSLNGTLPVDEVKKPPNALNANS